MPFLVNIKKRRNGAQPYFHAIRFIDCGEIVKGFGMLLGKEHGQAVPSPKALLWYAEYFDVSLDYLFGRTDSPHGIRYPYTRDHKPVDEKTQKVVDLCFDENSPVREKLKEALVGILGDAMWEENEHE